MGEEEGEFFPCKKYLPRYLGGKEPGRAAVRKKEAADIWTAPATDHGPPEENPATHRFPTQRVCGRHDGHEEGGAIGAMDGKLLKYGPSARELQQLFSHQSTSVPGLHFACIPDPVLSASGQVADWDALSSSGTASTQLHSPGPSSTVSGYRHPPS